MIKRQLLITALTLTLVTSWVWAQQSAGESNDPGATKHRAHHADASQGAEDRSSSTAMGSQATMPMQERWAAMQERMEKMALTEDMAERHAMMQEMREELRQLMAVQGGSQGMMPGMMSGQSMMPCMMGGYGMMNKAGSHQAVMVRLNALEQRLSILETQTQ